MAGLGVSGIVEGRSVLVGSARLMRTNGIDPGALEAATGASRAGGRSSIFVAVDGRLAGAITVEDPIKPSTADAIRHLHGEGLRIVMLTGDIRATAQAVADAIGIDEVIARRSSRIRSATSSSVSSAKGVWWPWQATASTMRRRSRPLRSASPWARGPTSPSRAPASPSSAAICAGIVRARRLSRATMRNIRQNLFLAFVYNTLGVPLAAGVLYPFVGVSSARSGRARR